MTEREAFLAWLETLEPPLPTTHDVEVAWRAWQARVVAFNCRRCGQEFANKEASEGVAEACRDPDCPCT